MNHYAGYGSISGDVFPYRSADCRDDRGNNYSHYYGDDYGYNHNNRYKLLAVTVSSVMQ